MKPIFTRLVFFILFALQLRLGNAQTYTISSNTNWTALSPSADWCNGCTFNISNGVTLNINGTTGCTNCTFNGGNIVVSNNFSFSGGTINNSQVTVNSASNYYTGSAGGVYFSGGQVTFNVGITCQACNFVNDAVNVNTPAGSTFTLQASGSYKKSGLINSTLTMSAGSTFYANIQLYLTNSSMTLHGDVLKSDNGTFSINNSHLYLYGSSSFAPTAGPLYVNNQSSLIVGDGSVASTAYFDASSINANQLQIDATSLVKIANAGNYYINSKTYQYTNASGTISSVPTTNNNINCNTGAITGFPHSCSANYVYGCATLSNTLVSCTVLATEDMGLTASSAGPGQTALSFTDGETSATDHYLIQRNSGNNDWQTITTVNAGGYTSGQYHYIDADAPAGSLEYRVEKIDQQGRSVYSAIASVTVEQTSGAIGIHPNPATGGNFYLTTPSTGEIIVNVYTITGQLILRTSCKGQTQYAIHLPVQSLSMSSVVVQTIGQTGNKSFTLLVR